MYELGEQSPEVHPSSQYLLSVSYLPGIVVNPGNTMGRNQSRPGVGRQQRIF